MSFAVTQAPLDQDGFRNAKPDLARGEHPRHLGRANAKHIGPERTTGWRMAVTTDTEHPWRQMPAFRKHDMADPLLVVKIGDILVLYPLTGQRLNGAGLVGICRDIVIGHHDDPVLVPHMPSKPFKHRLYTAWPAGIVDHRKVDLADHDITRRYGSLSGRAGNQFSGECFHEKTVA